MGMHAAWAAERKAALRGTRRHGGATAQHKTVTHWQPTYYTCRCKRLPFSLQKAIFYMAKGGLLQRERRPFAKRPAWLRQRRCDGCRTGTRRHTGHAAMRQALIHVKKAWLSGHIFNTMLTKTEVGTYFCNG